MQDSKILKIGRDHGVHNALITFSKTYINSLVKIKIRCDMSYNFQSQFNKSFVVI